jgi:hypothetical protein
MFWENESVRNILISVAVLVAASVLSKVVKSIFQKTILKSSEKLKVDRQILIS